MVEQSKGFTIKCNECGRETIFTKPEQDNYDIAVFVGYGGEADLICDCGNCARV